MFGKKDLVDNLSQDLDRARVRRDALASDVTTLSAEIARLEACLSEEKDRRERARIVAEIEEIADNLSDAVSMFAPAVAGLCDAIAAAGTVVPDAGELRGFLGAFAGKLASEIAPVMSELRRRAEVAHGGARPAQMPPPAASSRERMPLLIPEPLRRKEVPGIEAADGQRSTAA
jgi:hypothetical protein